MKEKKLQEATYWQQKSRDNSISEHIKSLDKSLFHQTRGVKNNEIKIKSSIYDVMVSGKK